MKKCIIETFFIIVAITISSVSYALIIDFDDLTISESSIPSNYSGLEWDYYFYVKNAEGLNNGYNKGMVSSPNVAYNEAGSDVYIMSDTPFTWYGAWFAAAWNDGLNIHVEGYRNNTLVYTDNITVYSFASIWYQPEWEDINKIAFSSSGGIPNSNYNNNEQSTIFVMDNFTIYESTGQANPIPEPSTLLLLAAGSIAGLAGYRKKKI